MRPAPLAASPVAAVPPASRRARARQTYFALIGERGAEPGAIDEIARSASRTFLSGWLDDVAGRPGDFPADLRTLPAWLARGHAETTRGYRQYLDARRAGAPRRFFTTRSHALHFLRAVAPTKLVDGAWLHGLLPRWDDARLAPLIRIYLEELGDGRAAQNHVLLYRQLLRQNDCDDWQSLPDEHYVQGALQLALAHHAAELLPEIIGFNLGYEQLPLHLPITAYELNELDIDPYYFTLHVTVDNASTGHARKSLDGLMDCLPRGGDVADFQRRVAAGYRLNDVGLGTVDAIASFDLERELLGVLADKAAVGAELHSDYCRIGGRTVSDWLGEPGRLPDFLRALETAGWIKRRRDPQESRFWRLLNDDHAPMFGVFDGYEQQLIRDWIVDDDTGGAGSAQRSPARFRPRPVPTAATAIDAAAPTPGASTLELVGHHLAAIEREPDAAHDAATQQLVAGLHAATDKGQAMALLAGYLSPANHPTPAGLRATRLHAALFASRSC